MQGLSLLLGRKYSFPHCSKLKAVVPAHNIVDYFAKTIFAPFSIAALTENKLVGKIGASSAFFNVMLCGILFKSTVVTCAVPLAIAIVLLFPLFPVL